MTTDTLDERLAPARQVADAVVYEGYVLYPYRASAAKNQVRWQFGVLAPLPWTRSNGGDASSTRTEVVVDGGGARLQLRVRLLQVQAREVQRPDGSGGYESVAELAAGSRVWASFDEAVEHRIDLTDVAVADVATTPRVLPFELPAEEWTEELAVDGITVGRTLHRRLALTGRVVVEAETLEGPFSLQLLRITVDNTTDWSEPGADRLQVVRHSLCAVHLLAAVDQGRWVSSLDPPKFASEAVATCRNEGSFPVLVGEPGDEVLLSSPIILYDHPAVAPESEGDMFDATEIDEILALRVLTLTDEEKAEARGTDPRAAAIIDRCEAMGEDTFSALHGTFRQIRFPAGAETPAESSAAFGETPDDVPTLGDFEDDIPTFGAGPGFEPSTIAPPDLPWWEPAVDESFDPWTDTLAVGGVEVGQGTRVRLCPSGRSDAQDLFLQSRAATVAGVFHDVDDDVFLAVVVDDDPAAELHQWHGRYLYFRPEEVEVQP